MTTLINPFKNGKVSKKKEKAKVNNTTSHIEDTSYCPVCNEKMQVLQANGAPSYACLEHRINLPIKTSLGNEMNLDYN